MTPRQSVKRARLFARAVALRRRLGLSEVPFGPVVPPKQVSKRWRRLLPELLLIEESLYAHHDQEMRAIEDLAALLDETR